MPIVDLSSVCSKSRRSFILKISTESKKVGLYRVCKLDVCESPIGIKGQARKSDISDNSKLCQLDGIAEELYFREQISQSLFVVHCRIVRNPQHRLREFFNRDFLSFEGLQILGES